MALMGAFAFIALFSFVWLVILSVAIVKLHVTVDAMKQSTHKIQFVDPFQGEFTTGGDEAVKAINKQFEEIV